MSPDVNNDSKSTERSQIRYAHSEGHTDLCFSEEGNRMITCGSDGDIRIWTGFNDVEPESVCVGESAFSVLQKGNSIYVCTDDSKVSVLKYPEGERDGLLTRFTAPGTHIATTKDHPVIVCCSEDFSVKVYKIGDSHPLMIFNESKGPVLSVAVSPNGRLVTASSGDGNMYVWNIFEKKIVKTIDCVPHTNSFTSSKYLCRMSFNPKGNTLAYPYHKDVIIVTTADFHKTATLTTDVHSSFSIVQFSPCGNYIAASTIEGEISIWNLSTKIVNTTCHSQKYNICALAWNPSSNGEIAYCDINGQIGILSGCVESDITLEQVEEELETLMESDDENAVSLEKLKNEVYRPSSALSGSIKSSRPPSPVRPSTPPDLMQPPFQPSSTPSHLESRFLVYNDVGIVQLFNDDDPSIDVQFHNATHFKNIFMKNHLKHTMASLSATVLALACETPSKLVCIPLKTSVKEWSCEMPSIEEILCVTASTSLVCVATNARMLRIFSIYGTQRAVISIPGPIVTLAAKNNALVAVYHANPTHTSNQNMSSMLIQCKGTEIFSKIIHFPLTPASNLSWVGFTDCGSIASYDDSGIVRLYRITSGVWIPVCDTNTHANGASDSYFLTHVSETNQNLQVILCRGSRYPLTIPRPIIKELPMQSTMCELESDKAQFEDRLFRWSQFQVEQSEKIFKENSIKLFALACRSDLDDRAFELLEILDDKQLTTMGLKYANKLNRNRLVEKLSTLLKQLKENDEETEEIIPSNSIKSVPNHSQKETSQMESQDMFSGYTPTFNYQDKNEIIIPKPAAIINPFLKKKTAGSRNPLSLTNSEPEPVPSTSKCDPQQFAGDDKPEEETFISWFNKQKPEMEEKFPEMDTTQITKYALQMYKLHVGKRKAAEDVDSIQKAKQQKLSAFTFTKH